MRRSQWPRGLRCRSAATRLLRLWVRIPPRSRMFVCCVLSGRGLCNKPITCPGESYRLWCVVVCDLENLIKNEWGAHGPPGGCSATKKKKPPRVQYILQKKHIMQEQYSKTSPVWSLAQLFVDMQTVNVSHPVQFWVSNISAMSSETYSEIMETNSK